LAQVDGLTITALDERGQRAFHIVESAARPASSTPVPPDVATCDDCLRELFDPSDRRYRYPFVNCTNCGPRFTIIRDLPYDRPLTTMAGFAMCADCAREYHDPANRRFHAQPVACPRCGPRVWLEGESPHDDAIREAQALLRAGAIVAVKGIGGFHLACDATNDAAVRLLRTRKARGDKPFAIMARDLTAARAFAHVDDAEAAVLQGSARPITLLTARATSALSPAIAPGNGALGVMLPYSPLHHLLLDGLEAPLVLTSGNVSDEPICKDNDDARERLRGLADALLMHDREVHTWCDDSVVRVVDGRELPVRRSRGFAPYPIRLTCAAPQVLAVGAELKSAFCLTRDAYAYLSQHIGDMGNVETLDAFERAYQHMTRLFRVEPESVVCDLHPGYLSSDLARRYAVQRGVPLMQVQHHHAHIAALCAEHGLAPDARVIGVVFDGTGYGVDGAIWGGEVLLADCASFERFAHLSYVPLPGGDAAVKRPYRVALAHLRAAGVVWTDALPCVAACPPTERRVLARQLERDVNCVATSSVGRLFDAFAALIGVRQTVDYEAQAAIELETLCAQGVVDGGYAFELDDGVPLTFNAAPVLRELARDVLAGVPSPVLAARVHAAVADLVLAMSRRARAQTGLTRVGLSGGVFQNVRLLRACQVMLADDGFDVLTHRLVPPNDGGLALGQAAVCVARLNTPCPAGSTLDV
jgi:hydrogenase maturation protein HypF